VTPPSTSVPPSTGEPKTDLGVTRTILAAERTLMAWVRTALSMISFGFAIYKFLEGVQESGAAHLRRPQEPRNIGLFLVVLGTGSVLAGMVEHVRTLRQLQGHRTHVASAFYLAGVVFIMGLLVLGGLLRHKGPF
jgi:putative membrane protein